MNSARALGGRMVATLHGFAPKCLALALALFASSAQAESGQLYAIVSEPRDELYDTLRWVALYRVEGDTLAKVRTITTSSQSARFVHPHHDEGLVLVGSHGAGGLHLDVIDLSRVSHQKSYDIDASCKACGVPNGHLLKMDGRLVYMVGENVGGTKVWYRGIDLATGGLVDGLSEEDEAHARSSDGQYINNDYLSARVTGDQSTTGIRVTRKADGTSGVIGWQGTKVMLRGFRQWVVAEEDQDTEQRTGRMVFYNADSGRQFTHDPGAEDSEALLIDEDDVAYYRIKDELWRGDITDGRLADTRRIAKAPEMPDVHRLAVGSW